MSLVEYRRKREFSKTREPALREDAATNVFDFMSLLQQGIDAKRRAPARKAAAKTAEKKPAAKKPKTAAKRAAKKAKAAR